MIRAAVLWDVPALRRMPVAASLLKAFDAPPWDIDQASSRPLNIAARGVVAATQGQVDLALETWEGLVSAKQAPDVRMLGHFLRAWADVPFDLAIENLRLAMDLALAVQDAEQRARIVRKAAILLRRLGEAEASAAGVQAAIEVARPGSPLHASLLILNWEIGRAPYPAVAHDWESDPLLSQPWIQIRALGSAIEAEKNRFTDELLRTWAARIRSGQTPLDVLNACQLQAKWAASVGLQDRLLQLMAAHLLSGAAQTEGQEGWAVSAWLSGGGDQIVDVIRRGEHAIDAEAARQLLDHALALPRHERQVPDIGAAIWDLLDDDGIGVLLDALDPGPLEDVTRDQARNVWGNLLWRNRAAWFDAWETLDVDRRRAAMAELIPATADDLTADERKRLLKICAGVPLEERGRLVEIVVPLRVAEGRSHVQWLAKAQPSQLLTLRDWRPDSVPDSAIKRAAKELLSAAKTQRDNALEGSFGIGGADTRSLLGRLSARLPRVDDAIPEFLVTVANDGRMPAEHQLGALEGLRAIRHAHGLSEELRTAVRAGSDLVGPQMWGVIDTGVLRVLRLYAVADELTHDETLELAAACRAPKREVRRVAVAAAADGLDAEPSSVLGWALVATLYDPADDIVEIGLAVIHNGALDELADVAEVAVAAVVSAFRTGRKSVRRFAVLAASRLAAYPGAEHLVRAAVEDPSWLVRRAAADELASDRFTTLGRPRPSA